jgi:hypothetical protein
MKGFFETQIKKQEIPIQELPDDIDQSKTAAPSAHEIDLLEENTQTNEQRLNHLLESKEILERRHAELIELRYVLRETAHFFEIVSPPLSPHRSVRREVDCRHKEEPMRLGEVRRSPTLHFWRVQQKKEEQMNPQKHTVHPST